jgi:outer membrane immunogenic protein
MKRLLLTACAGLLVAAMATPSFAADLPRPAYKAPIYTAPYFSWTGFYVGINGGYGFGRSEISNALGSTGRFDVKGGVVGGTLGYNYQTGSFVFGAEGDFDYSALKGSDPTNTIEVKNRYLGTARGRIGYAFDRFLPYITGGYAYGQLRESSVLGSESHGKSGYTLGGGLEYAFLGAWSAKVEYLYVKLSDSTCVTACGVPSSVDFKTNLVRVGLNYRF